LPAKKSQKNQKIDPKRYAQIIKGINLAEIYLESANITQKRGNLIKQKALNVAVKDKAFYVQYEKRVNVTHKYYLTAKTPEMEKDFALKVSAVFCITYTTDYHFEAEFFEIFKDINLPLNSWPYFREFVQNMTQRMNIPPLTLPVVKRA